MTEHFKIALPLPDGEGNHVLGTPVEAFTDEEVPDGRAVAIVDDVGAVLTPEQCFRLSDHFNRAGEVLEKYHDEWWDCPDCGATGATETDAFGPGPDRYCTECDWSVTIPKPDKTGDGNDA